MSESSPAAFTEEDEQLFQSVRKEILALPENGATETAEAPAAEYAAPAGAPTQPGQLRWKVVTVVVLLAAIAIVVGSLASEWLWPVQVAGSLTLLAIVIGWLVLVSIENRAARNKPPSERKRATSPWRRFAVSLAWFVLLGSALFPPVELAWLVGVLFFHELGHYLGMQWFGYRDVQMFFIPLFGAAVRGEKRGVPAWQEAIVLLLGPLPGLVLGCGIYFLDLAAPQPVLRIGAAWLVAINFVNLLPFEPLDGGRFCNRLLFSRFRWLEALSAVLAAVGLTLVCFGTGWICLVLSGAFALLVLAPARYKTATAAAALQARWPNLPAHAIDLSDDQWRDLFTITRGQLGGNAKSLAQMMKSVHTRAIRHPESGPATFGLFAVYLAAILLGIATASLTRLGEDTGRWPIRVKQQMTTPATPETSPAVPP